jgi:hypothetical protein
VELVPVADVEAPAAGPSVEAPAGTADAPAGVTKVPPALEEEEVGIVQYEVSNIFPRTPLISRGGRLLFCFLVDRVTPTVAALAPGKALKSGMPATTRQRSERVPRTAASAAAMGEPSRVTAAAARPQQEEVAATTSQALVCCAPSQGRGQARPESRPAGDHEAAGATADDDAPPGWGQLRGQPGTAPECAPGVLVMREDDCVISQRPAHDTKASMSHTAPPAPDVTVTHPE